MPGITLKVALSDGRKCTLPNITGHENASVLKSKIESKTGVAVQEQSFWLGDYPLQDAAPFEFIWDDVCRGNAIDVKIGHMRKERKNKPRHRKKNKK